MNEPSPRPWRVERNSGMFEIFGSAGNAPGPFSPTPKPPLVCSVFSEADAAFIVEAVNERDRLRKEILDLKCERDQLRKIVDRYERERMELCHKIGRREKDLSETANERDRLRDLVRRLYLIVKDANEFATSMASMFPELGDRRAWREMESILREAREAIGEVKLEGDGKC